MDDDLRARYRVNRGSYEASVRHRANTTAQHPHQNRPQERIAQPAVEPNHLAMNAHRPSRRRESKKLLIIVLIVGILGGLATWAYPNYMNKNPFPAHIQNSSKALLLYPSKLPKGFFINQKSMHFDNGKLIYDATKGNTRLVFTTQKTPPTFDYAAFYQQQLKFTRQFKTDLGEAAIGKLDDRYLGSLVIGNTWLLLSTNSPDVSSKDMHQVFVNLKKY